MKSYFSIKPGATLRVLDVSKLEVTVIASIIVVI